MTGKKYDPNLDTAAIAKLIRADIKALIAKQEIPTIKVSVRTRRFAGGSAIDIEVTGVPSGFVIREACEVHGRKLTEPARQVIAQLKEVHAAYNYNRSDAMTDYFDVNYYGGVQFDWSLESLTAEVTS